MAWHWHSLPNSHKTCQCRLTEKREVGWEYRDEERTDERWKSARMREEWKRKRDWQRGRRGRRLSQFMGEMKAKQEAQKGKRNASTWRRRKMMERWCGHEMGGEEDTQEAGIGMVNEWIDGMQSEQHGGRCNTVTERGRNASRCDIFNPWCFSNYLRNNMQVQDTWTLSQILCPHVQARATHEPGVIS